MKKKIYSIVIFLITITAFGCDKSDTEKQVTPELISFSLSVGKRTYRATVNKKECTAIIGGVQRGSAITAVYYELSEGATISPNPQSLIGQWKKEEQFTITSPNGESIVYTVILPEFSEDKTDDSDWIVTGYLPGNAPRDVQRFKNINWEYLTHVNIFFLRVTATGQLLDNSIKDDLEEIRNEAPTHNVHVLISLKSAPDEGFAQAIKDKDIRSKLVSNTIKYVQDNQLDGFDIDYEIYTKLGPDLIAFAKELHEEKDEGMLQTCAVLGYNIMKYTREWQNYFDYINVMTYDHSGPWSNREGPHSSYEKSVEEMENWMYELNTPASKLLIGLPFYGYTWDEKIIRDGVARGMSFSDILSYYPNEDVINNDVVRRTYYNGHPTIRKKCLYAKKTGLAGVMIWQIYQDAQSKDESLLNVIGNELFGEVKNH